MWLKCFLIWEGVLGHSGQCIGDRVVLPANINDIYLVLQEVLLPAELSTRELFLGIEIPQGSVVSVHINGPPQ